MKNKDYRNKHKLQLLYNKFSLTEIGTFYGITAQAVWLWIKKLGVQPRDEKMPVILIKDLKEVTGLSTPDLARLTNISKKEMYTIEQGGNPHPYSRRKIARIHDKVRKGFLAFVDKEFKRKEHEKSTEITND